MRILVIVALSIIAFGGGFIGVYLNLPEPLPEEPTQEPGQVPETAIPGVANVLAAADSTIDTAWLAEVASQARLVNSLIDSLTIARSDLQVAEIRIAALQKEVDRLNQLISDRASRQEGAASMAATLPKLEPNELTAILDGLDEKALFDLYSAASSRNRTTILQALKPDRASHLVQRFMSPRPDSTSRPATDL